MTECPGYAPLLNGYIDGELDAANVARVEQHLAECSGCRASLDRLQAVQDALRSPELRHAAPADLARRVEASVAPAPRAGPWSWRSAPAWLGGAAAGALAASLVLTVALPRASQPPLEAQLVDSHVRSLLAGHLADVRTTNQHIVKPWFNGRADLAPPVPELADLGFPLFGGRLDVVEGRVVPAIVYRRRLHTINLFVLGAGRAPASRTLSRDGYSIVEWSQGGLRFAAVSDIDAADLARFRDAYASRSPR